MEEKCDGAKPWRRNKGMKLNLEVEVSDDFIKLVSKQTGMTEEETVNFIKEYLEKLIASLWQPVLEVFYLSKAGIISGEEYWAKAMELVASLSEKCWEETRKSKKHAQKG
mgnify:CR=1 FL=1